MGRDGLSESGPQASKSAAALLLISRIGERFDGIVSGASAMGTWVRVFRPPVEGKVIGGQEGVDVGDRVTVELVGVNVERGFIDFRRVEEGPGVMRTHPVGVPRV